MAASARDVGDATAWSAEAARRVWGGAIPLHVHLHDADVTALPPPPPFLTLGPRIGYLPLLVPIIKAHFSSTLPPGVDTVWFEYKGLPLKWYIPIGVLFDLLCAEPERPWNLILLKLAIQLSEEPVRSVQKALYACCKRCKPWLIAITSASAHEGSLSKVDFRFTVLYSNRVHFRGYPAEILSPCEGEDSVKWSYNNSLKEAAFIITGNSKNVMNMSQADQAAMWESVRKGDMDSYTNISTRLKLGLFEEDWSVATSSAERQQGSDEPESPGSVRPCRVPVRLYVRRVQEDLEYLEDAIAVSDWESVSYINRPFEIRKEEGKSYITLARALETLLPEFFSSKPAADTQPVETADSPPDDSDTTPRTPRDRDPAPASQRGADLTKNATEVKLVRVQGIDLQNNMDVPFLWMANYLKNPECYLHVCVYVGAGI